MKHLLLIILLLPANKIFACDCAIPSLSSAVKNAEIIFTGKVVAKKVIPMTDTSIGAQWAFIEFAVIADKILKGKKTRDTIYVYTGFSDGTCGYKFDINQNYIIYGSKLKSSNFDPFTSRQYHERKNSYWTDICTRTAPFNKQEFAELKKHLNSKNKNQ